MALPIKPTPVIKGKDAERFFKEMEKSEKRVIDPGTKKRIHENYLKLSRAFKKAKLF
jgi:hypothetical protein